MFSRFTHLLSTASVLLISVCGAAQTQLKLTPISNPELQQKAAAEKPRQDATYGATEVLLTETFSGFEEGSFDEPTTEPLAAEFNNFVIDDSYTDNPGWCGDYVFSAGGAIHIHHVNMQRWGWIATPTGEWSGRLTVTFRAKALPCEFTGTSLVFQPRVGGIGSTAKAKTDLSPDNTVRIYPYQGWNNVSYTFDNLSADNDGYFILLVSGSVLIDDFTITCDNDAFIAPPHVLGAYDFADRSFSIAWEPVRNAFNYYIDLYEKVEDPDAEQNFFFDFDETMPTENFQMLSGSEEEPIEIVDGEGRDNTKGLRLRNGDSIVFDNDTRLMQNFKFYLTTYADEEDYEYEYSEYDEMYDLWMDGFLKMSVKCPDGTWKNIGERDLCCYLNGIEGYFGQEEGYIDYHYFDLQDWCFNTFANNFCGVKFTVMELPETAYVVFDDIVIEAERPYTLVRASDSKKPVSDDDNYAYYDQLDRGETEYTFFNLKADKDYYYRIRAHYLSNFSESNPLFAFGVGTPKVSDPQILSSNSYEISWSKPAKAKEFEVEHFGVQYSDGSTYSIFKETFDRIDETITDSDDPYEPEKWGSMMPHSLDAIADNKGWQSMYTFVSQGMAGCGEYVGLFNQMHTPTIDLSHSEEVYLKLRVYGTEGDALAIIDSHTGEGYAVEFSYGDEGGIIDGGGTITIQPGTDKSFVIYSLNQERFLIDEIEFSQVVPEGRKVYTRLDKYRTEEQKTTFQDLNNQYNAFAYQVTAVTERYDEEAYSTPSKRMEVNLLTGEVTEAGNAPLTSGIITVQPSSDGRDGDIDPDAYETARYTIDGCRIAKPVPGMNIVVYSNGKVRKEVVK